MSRYYISTGEKGCFYTLRYSFLERFGHGSIERDYHVCNLSTDPDEAVERAKVRVGEGYGFAADFSVNAIERRPAIDWSVFQAGTKIGQSIHEVLAADRDYLLWACEALSRSPRYAKTLELARSLVGQALAAREAERQRAAERQAEERGLLAAILSPLAERLKDGKGGFRDSVAEDLIGGRLPAGRGLGLVIEILAKSDGRKGSPAYCATEAAVRAVFERAARVPHSLAERERFAPLLSACDRLCDALVESSPPDATRESDAIDALTAACSAVRERLSGLSTPQPEDLSATLDYALRVREHLLLLADPDSSAPLLAALDKAVCLAGEPWAQEFSHGKKVASVARSFLCEVQVDGSWSTNGLRFASPSEADDYGWNLFARWTGPTAYRTRARPEEPNARFYEGAVELLESHSTRRSEETTGPAAASAPASIPPASAPMDTPGVRQELLAAASELVAFWRESTDSDSYRARLIAAAAACGPSAPSDDLLNAVRALRLEAGSEDLSRLQRALTRERAVLKLSAYLEENPRDLTEPLKRIGVFAVTGEKDLELVRALVDGFLAVDSRGLDQFTSSYLAAACQAHGVRTFSELSHGTLLGLVAESVAFSLAHQSWLMDQVPASSGGNALWSARHGGIGFRALGIAPAFDHLQSAAIAAGPKRLRRAGGGKLIDEGEWDGELFEVLARELCPGINASWSPAESVSAALERLATEGIVLAGDFPSGWVAVPQGRRGVFVVSSDGWRHRLMPSMEEARAFALERPYRFSLCASSTPPAMATHAHCVEAPGNPL